MRKILKLKFERIMTLTYVVKSKVVYNETSKATYYFLIIHCQVIFLSLLCSKHVSKYKVLKFLCVHKFPRTSLLGNVPCVNDVTVEFRAQEETTRLSCLAKDGLISKILGETCKGGLIFHANLKDFIVKPYLSTA